MKSIWKGKCLRFQRCCKFLAKRHFLLVKDNTSPKKWKFFILRACFKIMSQDYSTASSHSRDNTTPPSSSVPTPQPSPSKLPTLNCPSSHSSLLTSSSEPLQKCSPRTIATSHPSWTWWIPMMDNSKALPKTIKMWCKRKRIGTILSTSWLLRESWSLMHWQRVSPRGKGITLIWLIYRRSP